VNRLIAGRPRLVATDLDGTLLRTDGTVSDGTVAVLRAVEREGVRLVVVTARPPRWMHDLLDVIGEHGLAIYANGAFVYDVVGRRVVSEHTLTRDVVTEIAADLRQALPGIAFAVEHREGIGREPNYVELHPVPPGSPIAVLEQLIDPPPGKLLARHEELDPEAFVAAVTRVVGDRAVVVYSGLGGLAEIRALGVTKAAALADWCLEHGVDASDVWAFGDMPNDVPMLSWAGRSYAVANAHPDVAAVATDRCASNDDDGVARVLAEALGIDAPRR
jgi:hydroxymethylpyrimidine pyrophosphatase-like HAD family hydrolase